VPDAHAVDVLGYVLRVVRLLILWSTANLFKCLKMNGLWEARTTTTGEPSQFWAGCKPVDHPTKMATVRHCLNPFSIWNSYSFHTELPALLVLALENKQKPWHFLLNTTLLKFSFSVQVYFNLKQHQHGQNVNMFSPCLLLLLSCEVRPLWVRQVRYVVETETGVLCSVLNKLFVNVLLNTNILLQYELIIKIFQK